MGCQASLGGEEAMNARTERCGAGPLSAIEDAGIDGSRERAGAQ